MIPDGVDLRLTVDPYDHYIKASGVDEKLAEKIEAALNRGKMGSVCILILCSAVPDIMR